MRNIHQFLRNYFGFTLLEARGFWVWTLGIGLLFLLNFSFVFIAIEKSYISKKEVVQFEEVLATLAQQDTSQQAYPGSPNAPFGNEAAQNFQGERFIFNPNHASEADLKKLGIPQRFVKSILKFRSKGGSFRKKSDLKKIYNFPENLYAGLEEYIDLPETNTYKRNFPKNTETTKARKNTSIEPFDLNTADTATLSQVRGIGAKTAQSIVDFREKLGGFVRLEQLQEVYFLKNKPELVGELMQYARLTSPQIRKINPNTATLEAMKAHPYFSKLAKYLVVCRDKNKFKSLEEVQKLKAVAPDIWEKMKDYIVIE